MKSIAQFRFSLPWSKLIATPVILACAGLGGWTLIHGSQEQASSYRPPAAFVEELATQASEAANPTQKPVALFIGDSYTAGAGGIRARSTYAALTCRIMRWQLGIDALPGTGYATASGGQNYQDRLYATSETYAPDYVFVTGGYSDTMDPEVSDSDMKAAARNYLARVQGDWPEATVFVLSPFWVDENPGAKLIQLRKHVRSAAKEAGLTWVDTDDWLQGKTTSSDGVNVTGPGHASLAKHLIQILEDLGVSKFPKP